MFDLALRNCRIFDDGSAREANIYIEAGKIAKVARTELKAEESIDCARLLVMPGVVDSHVHFREPGFTDKEDWRTGSAAAAAGGVCTVIDMPNCRPPTTTALRLEAKRAVARKKSSVNALFHFGATGTNAREIAKAKGFASVKVFMGSSTGGLLVCEDRAILASFAAAAARGVPASVHAEDEAVISASTQKAKDAGSDGISAHAIARPVRAAARAVARAIDLSARAGNRLHVLHVSSGAELLLVREAKRRGARITCEVTPHHLFLSEKDVERLGFLAKTNPPVRSDHERAALWRGLSEGVIDVVGSDHAPHTIAEKQAGSVWEARAGVPGVQTLIPLMLDAYSRKLVSFARIVEATSAGPARIFGLKGKGGFAPGMDADFSVVDLRKEWRITDDLMLSKCGWTPFDGMTVKGAVAKTIVKGKPVFEA